MKAKYVGHPAQRDDENIVRRVGYAGKSFPRDHFVSLDGLKPSEVAKLKANPAFEVSDDALTNDEAVAANTAGAASPPPGSQAPAAGLDGLDKAQILERLEGLKAAHPDAGIEFGANMGLPKLRSILEDALFAVGGED